MKPNENKDEQQFKEEILGRVQRLEDEVGVIRPAVARAVANAEEMQSRVERLEGQLAFHRRRGSKP